MGPQGDDDRPRDPDFPFFYGVKILNAGKFIENLPGQMGTGKTFPKGSIPARRSSPFSAAGLPFPRLRPVFHGFSLPFPIPPVPAGPPAAYFSIFSIR